MKLITDMVDEWEKQFPNKKAIVCDNKHLTFKQVNNHSYNFSYKLKKIGIKKGDAIGLFLPNSVEYMSCFLGPIRLGAVTVPLRTNYTSEILRTVIKDCKIKIIITIPESVKLIEEAIKDLEWFNTIIIKYPENTTKKSKKYSNLKEWLNTPSPKEKTKIKLKLSDHAVYQYTSGTTGNPKGVILRQRDIAYNNKLSLYKNTIYRISCAIQRKNPRIKPTLTMKDKCLTLGGLYHAGKMFLGLINNLVYGRTLYVTTGFDPDKVVKLLMEEKISYFHANPVHFGVMAQWKYSKNTPPLKKIKFSLSSGNRLYKDVFNSFKKRFDMKIYEHYGTTETGGVSVNGRPYPSCKIKIVDEYEKTLKPNKFGRILVKGTRKSNEYLNLKLDTTRKGNWVETGDMGKIGNKGKLHIICRKQNLIHVKGKDIFPDEIRDVLLNHKYIENAMIKSDTKHIKAFIKTNKQMSKDDIMNYCKENLEEHKIPKIIEFSNELPPLWLDSMEEKEFNQMPQKIRKMFNMPL